MYASKRMNAFFEDGDLFELETRSPRGVRDACDKLKGIMQDSDTDTNYGIFLSGLVEFLEQKIVEEDEMDPTYMMFLDNLKEHGDAYMLDLSMEHGLSSPIIYEVEGGAPVEPTRKIPRSQRGKLIRESKSLGLVGASSLGVKNIGTVKGNTYRCTPIHRRSCRFLDRELELGLEHSSYEKGNSQTCSRRIRRGSSNARKKNLVSKRSQEVYCSSDHECKSKSNAVAVDETYQIFLKDLQVNGESVFYEFNDGKRVYYEISNQERSNDAEMVCMAKQVTSGPKTHSQEQLNPVLHEPTPTLRQPIPSQPYTSTPRESSRQLAHSKPKHNGSTCGASNNGKVFHREREGFWEELSSIVRKPYKQAEYEGLLQKVNARTRVAVHRETRTGGYKAEPGPMGKSYLETYPDLEYEILEVKSDHRKVLNLLRGFFLYLQKIPFGVEKPWMNATGRKIMLGSP